VVIVKDSGAPPILEFYAENLDGRGTYTGLNLFITFDHQSLAVQSQYLTTSRCLLAFCASLPFIWEPQNLCRSFKGTYPSSYKRKCPI